MNADTSNAGSSLATVTIHPESHDHVLSRRAAALAERLDLPLSADGDMLLRYATSDGRLELHVIHADDPQLTRGKPLSIELAGVDATSPMGKRLTQPLFKGIGVKKGDPYRPRVLDATVGLGEDAWLMASIGCEVTALERSLVVAALLENAVQRIAQRQPDVAARLRLQCMDALDYLAVLASEQRDPPDVIYIDPMFPPRRSKTVERKPMRVLRSLVGEDADATALLDRARQVARKRVVVKRPLRAEALDDVAPDLTFKGNAVRYDLYLNTS